MASVFKRGRWIDPNGRKCTKHTPGAKWTESRFYTVQVNLDGRIRRIKGYTDRAASEQMGAKLERAKAQGAEGLDDPYKAHRNRRLSEHVADWIAELRQLGRDDVYVGLCESRIARLIAECDWKTFSSINADSFIRWRATATSTVGHSAKRGANILTMGARTQNHYLETVRAFCKWSIKRKRLAVHPLADVTPVETAGQLRRQRRALTQNEITALLSAVHARHQLAYRIILGTGLRRDELRQLRWGDVMLDAPMPCILLRAETTKGKRADVLPLRIDLASMLKASRGEADDSESVCRSVPSMDTHKRYLAKAAIPFEDTEHRRADFHSLRHTYGSLLASAGIAPRIAMSLMRHTDMRLTMNVYTDPRIFDLAGAVEKLPALPSLHTHQVDEVPGWRESVTRTSAAIGICSAVSGTDSAQGSSTLSLVSGRVRQQKSPSGRDGENERVKGVEPSTFTLATKSTRTSNKCMRNELQLQ